MTAPAVPLLAGAAELVVSMGALEVAPLAEVSVDGAVVPPLGVADEEEPPLGVADEDDPPLGVADDEVPPDGVDGEDGGLVLGEVDLVGVGVVDPLGRSEGVPLPVGVGSSDVPIVPSGPGSVGLLVAVPVVLSSPFFAGSAPRLSSSVPWLADGLTPTLSDGLSALLLDVAPRVTTVPRTAASRTPAPAATRLRRA
jgi:hypothetical protein